MIKNGKVFSLELHMDQSFVYHLKLVISRLPSQIPWWDQPSVTFRYCIVSLDLAGTCQTNILTNLFHNIIVVGSKQYYRGNGPYRRNGKNVSLFYPYLFFPVPQSQSCTSIKVSLLTICWFLKTTDFRILFLRQ